MALPRVRAALNYLPVDYAIDKINNKDSLDNEKLAQLIDTAQASISLDDNPQYWEGLSTLFLYRAQKDDLFQEASVKSLKLAKHSMEQSLSRSPANAYLWYRLSVVHTLLQLPAEQMVKMLTMSIMTGPNEPEILMQRLSLCLMFFDLFEQEDIDLLRSQILTAWSLSPADFLGDVANDEEQMSIIRLLLADNHAAVLEEMDEALEKTH
ncbi:MAG: hypothetical protein Q7U57_18575 [Methylovulum sp.]|nr:hypothetical protein [Methylovulum sp.]